MSTKFSMIQDAVALSKIKGSTGRDAVKEIKTQLGTSISDAAKIYEEFSMKIAPADYDEWLKQIVMHAEHLRANGEKVSLNKRTNFEDIAGEVLENDPAGKVNPGDEELVARVNDALWKRYQHHKDHLRVSKVQDAREEEEFLKRAAQEVEDEETNVDFAPHPEETDEFVPSRSNYDADDMSGHDEVEGGEMEPQGGGEPELHDEEGMEHHEEDAAQENPYEEGTPEHEAWLAGFSAGTDSEATEGEGDVGDEGEYAGAEGSYDDAELPTDDLEAGHEEAMAGPGEHEVADDAERHELEQDTVRPTEEEEHAQYTKGFGAARKEYHTGLKNHPKNPHPQWSRGYEDFMQDTEGQREVARVTRGATEEEEVAIPKLTLRDVLRGPHHTIKHALKKVEFDGARAFHAMQMPGNPHPEKSLAQKAWAKGFKNAVGHSLGIFDKPVHVKGKSKKKK